MCARVVAVPGYEVYFSGPSARVVRSAQNARVREESWVVPVGSWGGVAVETKLALGQWISVVYALGNLVGTWAYVLCSAAAAAVALPSGRAALLCRLVSNCTCSDNFWSGIAGNVDRTGTGGVPSAARAKPVAVVYVPSLVIHSPTRLPESSNRRILADMFRLVCLR